MNNQKRILVLDSSGHPIVLENVYHILKDHCEVTFYLNKDKTKSEEVMFPSLKKSRLIRNKTHYSVFFVGLLFIGRKYDYINISTGPESNHFSQAINVLFFYLCCVFYKKKIILTIKNLRPYMHSTPGLFSFIRSRGVKHLKRFTFETKTIREVYKKYAKIESGYYGVSYDRYTDLFNSEALQCSGYDGKEQIRIGLLGAIDSYRRDYKIVIDALSQMSAKKRSKLQFLNLGVCQDGIENEIVKEIKKYAEFDCHNGTLSAQEFDLNGASCDILLSPLRREMEYGTFKGSGSFGDAVYLKKWIIIPLYTDEYKEFEEIAVYYQNVDELSAVLENINELFKTKINPKYYEQFTIKNVFKNLMKDLNIDEVRAVNSQSISK